MSGISNCIVLLCSVSSLSSVSSCLSVVILITVVLTKNKKIKKTNTVKFVLESPILNTMTYRHTYAQIFMSNIDSC